MPRLAALLAVLLLFVGSCATGRGQGFSQEAARERAAHTEAEAPKDAPPEGAKPSKDQPPPPPPPTITINATPQQARISLNGQFLGTRSASFVSAGFGRRVTVRVEAPAYRTQTLDLTLWGQTQTIAVDLQPILGTLEVTGNNLEGAALSVDGQALKVGANPVLIGDRTLRVERFGYTGVSMAVTIRENETTSVTADLEPAAFDLTNLASDRPAFNPDSAAIAATLGFSFRASGPGHAALVLTDARGLLLRRWDYPALTTWNQSAAWNGLSVDGVALPDGPYDLTLTGGVAPGVETVKKKLSVRIDRSLVDKDRSTLGPAAGLLWVPTAEVLSPGTLQVSVLGLGHAQPPLLHVPLSTAVRFSPAQDWEVFGQASFRLWSDPYLNSGYATFSVKQRLETARAGFRAAWLVGATAGSWLEGASGVPPTDFLTTYPALRASLPVSWSWGRWTLMLAPEVDASYWSPSTAYEAAGPDEGLRLWAYGRAGLAFDPGPFSLAVSGAARTRTFDRGAGFLAPAQLGFEARWPLPSTPVTLTGYASVSAYSTDDYAWYGGLGVSLLLPPTLTLDLVSRAINSP